MAQIFKEAGVHPSSPPPSPVFSDPTKPTHDGEKLDILGKVLQRETQGDCHQRRMARVALLYFGCNG